ncbi:MAG: CHC2 zinc finger domain-containing protein [Actinobacteria bacterium]|nr:CHC2 zinc finger domain-containing protein [Actinomycetota bacterium]
MTKILKDGEVNELKLNVDIYNIISNYVNLKKSGKNFIGLCPFHKEKTPSFIVDSKAQLYHCFGCGAGGDVISFIMKVENLSFMEAVELLAKKVGYNLKFIESKENEEPDSKEKLFELNELAKKYFNYILFNSKNGIKALNYLKSRKISEETLKIFEVGYSIDNWENFTNFAKSRNYNESDIILAGLGIESQKPNKATKVYDRFRGRIMFPIKDLLGRTIGFGGRILPYNDINNINTNPENLKNLTVDINKYQVKTNVNIQKNKTTNIGENVSKYINTPETRLYSKSKNIYGIFEAKSHIVKEDYVLIVEGYMDLISLYDNEIKNVVASLGTALTSDQIKIISRFTKNIILVFDGDEAGINASVKGIDRLKEYNENLDLFNENNIRIKVCTLDKNFDPADFIIKKGKEAFLEKIKNAIDIIDYTLNIILSKYNLNDLTDKLRASDELLRFISTLSSSIIQEECIKKIAPKLRLKESMLIEEMLKIQLKKKGSQFSEKYNIENDNKNSYSEFISKNMNPQKRLEIEALSLIINGSDYPELEILNLPLDYFKFEDTKELFKLLKNIIYEQINSKRNLNFPVLISSDTLENENIRKLYNYIYFSNKNYTREKDSCKEVVLNLKKLFLSEKIEKIKNKISEIEQIITQNKLSGNVNKDTVNLEKEIDEFYKELISLENEKLLLGKDK